MPRCCQTAIEELQRAITLSPYDSLLFLWTQGLAAACFGLGRHEEGVAWARKSVQQNPGNGTSRRLLAANLAVLLALLALGAALAWLSRIRVLGLARRLWPAGRRDRCM